MHRSRFTDGDFGALPPVESDFDLIGATVASLRAGGMDVQRPDVASVLHDIGEIACEVLRRRCRVNLAGMTLPDFGFWTHKWDWSPDFGFQE